LLTSAVDNYPGFPDGVSGQELADRMRAQMVRFGAAVETGEATAVHRRDDGIAVSLSDGREISSPAVIVATGGSRRKLGVPGEDAFAGKGVSYCAVCDGALFRNRTVAVIGGGDTALEDACLLARVASRVYLIHRRDTFRAVAHLQKAVKAEPRISPMFSHTVSEIRGAGRVELLVLNDLARQKTVELPVEGVFVSIGLDPNTSFLAGTVEMTGTGHIVTDEEMATSCPGIFAVGDCRRKPFYQIVTACADGAVAAWSVQRYLERLSAG